MCHSLGNINVSRGGATKVLWTIRSAPFTIHKVGMTESLFDLEPAPPSIGACGEGTKLKLVRLRFRGVAILAAAVLCVAAPFVIATLGGLANAGEALEERKLPMQFSWIDCQPHCRGWISAVGIVTSDSPKDFDEFAEGRDLRGATVVLDSSGGSVNDSILLGRRFRSLGLMTTVGTSIQARGAKGTRDLIDPDAYCESMCVFLLLSGKTRYVPDTAHVRVHQIWMGDRADDARAASYSAEDLMIVERDIGRLAKYTFEMGGGGDLLSLSLNVPPWEELHELSREELRLTNLVTTDVLAEVLSPMSVSSSTPVAALAPKPVQDRLVSTVAHHETVTAQSTKTAEALAPASDVAGASPQH